ncbi:MAG TPA: cell wall protein [Streptomyces sp.]|nr:cell wall protein [Streptomyces sp.]
MPRTDHEIDRTASRHAQPRAWQRAVRWLVSAGLHPRANATTVRVAEDLARRMDYTEGTVLYGMAGTARRLDVSVPTIKRHVAYLRELGALVWVEHGSRRNLHLPGRAYTATATVYAATIPRVYDEAMGHRIDGHGYDARIVGVTDEGRERAVAEVRRKADSRRPRHDPPSPGGYQKRQKVEVSGGLKDTPRAACPNSSTPKTTTNSSRSGGGRQRRARGTGRPAHQVARDIAIARRVRPLVSWTQTECLRRLAYALRPLIDAGQDAHDIAAELHSWFLDWRPARPAAYITAQLRDRSARDTAVPGVPTQPTEEFRAMLAQQRHAQDDDGQDIEVDADTDADVLAGLSREEIIALRAAALDDPALVLAAVENLGMRDARRLYTSWLVDQALARSYRVSSRTVIHG